ncbi:malto-oligosyltrehalose synthase [Piscinibacter sp. XHJ-5]|uniref:malto-oligosyltrehalose synthase n=1 Tax=Piscinibacter sp. XHJ-5 TaxID=3037797 RepID=UPI00245342FE|nr:malto-oligosyltrehalose synthase [Piscinibacter sp. XHJ-5]
MAEPGSTLAGWCERVGIAADYHDIWGHRHRVPDAGLAALLREFGIDPDDAQALADAQRADWGQPLPAVAAHTAGAPRVQVQLRVPAGSGPLHWTLHEESGAVHRGAVDPVACTVLGQAQVDGQAMQTLRAAIDLELPTGYHRLVLDGTDDAEGMLLVSAPEHAYRPPALQADGRVWGPALQLYALRSPRNWGIGDFTDLATAAELFAQLGAGIVGLNPLHALFPHNPHHISPYSPSSRSQLNTMYLDVEAVADFPECTAAQQRVRSAAFQERLAQLREAVHVDYAGVAAAKDDVLRLLWAHFRERHLRAGSERGRAFRDFLAERGEPLALHATFNELQARLHAEDASVWGWPVWPEAYRDPASDAVSRFREEHGEAIEFHAYLQWQADLQLARVARRCSERGLAVGLYLDLAVSVDRAGADMWTHQAHYAPGASVGAPPDELNLLGQDWGLPPLRPDRLLADRCRYFADTLRACMRHAGALRIDHVMGLMRLYWIPAGQGARAGAYVHYPLAELMAIVALESERNRCMVIGEDLGTVADEMRAAVARLQVLSYRVVAFERGEGGTFKPPHVYPREALVAVGTHDLPTLAGWWSGHDLQVRRTLGLFPSDQVYEDQLVGRMQERVRLLLALQHAALLPDGLAPEVAAAGPLTAELAEAVHAFAASTPSRVMVVQPEDVLGVLGQANLPGTVDQHPNWRQKLPLSLQQLAEDERLQSTCRLLARLRPHAPLSGMAPPRTEAVVPRATYRLQFHRDFTFDDAQQVLAYLQGLGVSHLYCSPVMRARPGSTHGYDIVAHDEINPELGGREAFDRFARAARERGMGLLIDMVPNHMGIFAADNAWWMDVLQHGPASAHASWFDIDWHPVDRALDGRVLLPVLGDHFGGVLERGELALVFEGEAGSFSLRYFEHRFPLDPRTAAPLLLRAAERLPGAAGLALQSVATGFGQLPPRDTADPHAAVQRRHDHARLQARLVALLGEAEGVRAAIEAVVAASASPDSLDALHEAQAFRLAYWRVASDEINYRRFFDINHLAALRMEEPDVFEATQGFALDLAAAGVVDGLRIDHPDGLHDPAQYFERLQQGYARRAGIVLPRADAHGRPARPLYVVAEKIAAGHEDIPESWALHGTTGYRFANVVNGVLVDTAARERFDRLWQRFSGEPGHFEEFAYAGKRTIMRSSLASELTVLATELLRIARAHRRTRDHTFNTLREALAEVAACMPVYRTYIVDKPSAQDQRFIDWAVASARRRARAADTSIFDFVRRTLLAEAIEGADDALKERVRRFAMRFQQFTAPVTAKGVEDTAFYRYHRLVSLNEVGGDPGTFGMTLRGFHAANADRAARWPYTIVATSTHDNKRSEDVRCRLDVLSEMPAAWRLWLRRFNAAPQLQRARHAVVAGHADAGMPVPSRADEVLLLQTLLGTLPAGGLDDDSIVAYRERIEAYAVKAAREAKRHTSWVSPDAEYEDGLRAFVRSVLARVRPNPVLTELQAQAELLGWFGALNSLAMVLLKFTVPGVPDLYQGNEVMDLSLVDPDNRRPVDYEARRRLLDELQRLSEQPDWRTGLAAMTAAPHDGRLKLWIIWRLLQLRRQQPELLRDGGYAALQVTGQHKDHVVAFVRETAGQQMVVACGRWFARLLDARPAWPAENVWGDAVLEVPGDRQWRDVLSGQVLVVDGGRPLPVASMFATLPMAVLVPE